MEIEHVSGFSDSPIWGPLEVGFGADIYRLDLFSSRPPGESEALTGGGGLQGMGLASQG